MSKRIGKIAVIFPEPPGICELCGKRDELRPYGPKGERICFDCAEKDIATTKRQMDRVLFGEEMN